MATADIIKEAVYDNRVVQPFPTAYAVQKGALSNTSAPFNAISSSASQISFNINAPSQNVFLDRGVDYVNTAAMQANVAIAAPFVDGQPVLRFGQDAALAALPLAQMIATASLTINDTTVTMDLESVLQEVLRLTDYRPNRKQRTCPTTLDNYLSYDDAYLAVNSPLASYVDAVDTDLVGNGSFGQIFFTNSIGAPLVGTGVYQIPSTNTYVGYANGIPIRSGSTVLPAVGAAGGPPAGSSYVVDGVGAYTVFLKFSSCEKLVISPFVFADSHADSVGLYGLNNLQIVLNLKANTSRVLRSTTGGGRTVSDVGLNQSVIGSPFSSTRLNCIFLTPPLSLPLPAMNSVEFMQYPRYQTVSAELPAGKSTTLQSQNIVLPYCPDFLIVSVKPTSYLQNEGDFYLTPENVTINWDNFSGLLSSYSQQQLYQMAVENGLNQSWPEWSGTATSGRTGGPISTVGGFLIFRLSKDIVTNEGIAPGILGNYSLQLNVQVTNRASRAITPVLQIIAVNSGEKYACVAA